VGSSYTGRTTVIDKDITQNEGFNTVDPVEMYLSAAGEAPLLNAEQEIQLAQSIEKGDLKARELMIMSNE